MRQLLLSWAILALLLAPALADEPADLQSENTQLRARIEQLQKENTDLHAQLDALTQKNTALVEEQTRQQAQFRQLFLATNYDADADRTAAFTPAMKLIMLRGNGCDHFLTLSTSYPGKQPAEPIREMTLTLNAWFTGDIYRNAKSITFDIDGQSVDCPIDAYQIQRRKIGAGKKIIDQSDILVTAPIPMSAVRSIASASKVTGTIGHVQFQLPREVNEACKALAQSLPQ